jgi:hypothetical protein
MHMQLPATTGPVRIWQWYAQKELFGLLLLSVILQGTRPAKVWVVSVCVRMCVDVYDLRVRV